MPLVRVLVAPTAENEPITLALLKAQVRKDADDEDELLQLYASAAREKVEAYTGRYFAAQTLEFTFELGEPYLLPSEVTATAVTGAIADLDALANLPAYVEEYRKGITVERQLAWPYPALAQTFTVTATTTGDRQFANLAKRVMLAIAADYYRNREISELSAGWKVDLAPARVTVLGTDG